ncbi:MAG: DUF58 domain-containing protein [Cyanobium sp.]
MDFGKPEHGPTLRLGLRNLYIVPTRFGWSWLAGLMLLQLVGIQMQSNGPLLLSYLMLGLFLLALHLTHFNLQGLELTVADPQPGFAGLPLVYPLILRSPGRCEGLRLRFTGAAPGASRVLEPGEHRLAVPWTPSRRGLHPPTLLQLETTAPLGLFVCWARWQPTVPQLVYPARRAGPVRLLGQTPHDTDPPQVDLRPDGEGSEEWRDLHPHRPQDSASRVAWKLLAQGRGRYAKRFADPSEQAPLLAPDPSLPFEQALEHLSERIWRLHAQGCRYGLLLNGERIAAGRGPAQRDRTLAALAHCR